MIPSMDVLNESSTSVNSRLDRRLLNGDSESVRNGITSEKSTSDGDHNDNCGHGNLKRPAADTKTPPSMMNPIMDCRKLMSMIGGFYWLILIAVILPTACVSTLFIFIYPTMLFSMTLFNRLEHELCRMVNEVWVAAGQYAGLTITEYGDDIAEYADKRCLCLANHLGLIDHFCLMTAFHDKKTLSGKYLWVIFNIWKFTTLGMMWTAHGNFFINGGVANRIKKLEEFRTHLERNYIKHDYGWIVMYPEDQKINCNIDAMTAMPDSIEYIVDCTLGYPRGEVAPLGEAMLGEWSASNVAIHYRVHRIRPEWVADEMVFRDWLYEQYKLKDDLLDDFYWKGHFPGAARRTPFPISRNLIAQAFWLGMFYLHFNVWMRPLVAFILKSVF